MKKKSIYDKKMEDARFKAVYDEVSVKLDIGEKIAELREEKQQTENQKQEAEKQKQELTDKLAIFRDKNKMQELQDS